MIEGLITGRLTTDPVGGTDGFGEPFMVARMGATVGGGNMRPHAAAEIPVGQFVTVVAFDPVPCTQLLDLQEGDVVSIVGPLTPKVWTDKQGASYPALDVVAYRVLAVPTQIHSAEFAYSTFLPIKAKNKKPLD